MRSKDPAAALDYALRVLEIDNKHKELNDGRVRIEPRERLIAVRLIQLALGDLTAPDAKANVWAGYSPAETLPAQRHPRGRAALRGAYPSNDANLDRELTRTLAVLEDDDAAFFAAVVDRLTPRSDPLDDVHHLIVLSPARAAHARNGATRSPGAADARSQDRGTSAASRPQLAAAHRRVARGIEPQGRETERRDPESLGLRPRRSCVVRSMSRLRSRRGGAEVRQAAPRRTPRSRGTRTRRLAGEFPPEVHRPLLRSLPNAGLDDAVPPLLAKSAQAEDAPRLLAGLTSPRLTCAPA